jgi:hypothetical protein
MREKMILQIQKNKKKFLKIKTNKKMIIIKKILKPKDYNVK